MLVTVGKVFNLVRRFSTLNPYKMLITSKHIQVLAFSGFCYLTKESSQARTIYDQTVKVPQGFAV